MIELAVDNGRAVAPPVDEARRKRLARLNIARKALRIEESDYRALLERLTGQRSAKALADRQLDKVLAELDRMGGKAAGRARPPADNPIAAKAKAMWLSLHQLGAIDDPSDDALNALCKRQLGVDRLQWADQRQGYRLIEALKAIAERHGWGQKVSARMPVAERVRVLKLRLLDAQIARLFADGIEVGRPFTEDRATWPNRRLERAAGELGVLIHARVAALACTEGAPLDPVFPDPASH